MMREITLQSPNKMVGMSGCTFTTYFNDTVLVVRKISENTQYNHRLELQRDKMEWHKDLLRGIIQVPEIYGSGELESGLYYIDMEYINLPPFYDHLSYLTRSQVHHIIDTLGLIISKYMTTGPCHHNANLSYITSTMSSIHQSALRKVNSLASDTVYIDLLEQVYYNIDCIKTMEETYCHGDLSLMNIMTDGGRMCVLDFLDSYVNSYIIDLIKLRQSCTYNLGFTPTLSARSFNTIRYIGNTIESEFLDVTQSAQFRLLEAINFLRLEPYYKKSTVVHTDEVNRYHQIMTTYKLSS